MPIVRAFAPIVAGAGEMDYKKFMIFNLAGGVFWAIGITGAGYYLGSIIPNIDKYLFPIIGIIILASISPALHAILINAEIRASIINKFKKGI